MARYPEPVSTTGSDGSITARNVRNSSILGVRAIRTTSAQNSVVWTHAGLESQLKVGRLTVQHYYSKYMINIYYYV